MRRAIVLLAIAASLTVLVVLAGWGMRTVAPSVLPRPVASGEEAAPAAVFEAASTESRGLPSSEGDSEFAAPARTVLPQRPAGVVGTVRDPDGRAVADAIVVLMQHEEQEIFVPLAEITGSDGVFRVGTRAITVGTSVVAQHEDHPPVSIELTEEHLCGTPIELRFARGIAFSGRLLGTTGRPIGGARGTASAAPVGVFPELGVMNRQVLAGKRSTFTTDRDGRFACHGWPPGTPAHIHLQPESDRRFEAVRATAGKVSGVGDFVIDPTDGGNFTMIMRVGRRVRIDVRGAAVGLPVPVRTGVRASIEHGDGSSRPLRLRWNDERFRANSELMLAEGEQRTCELLFQHGDGVERRFGPYVVDGPISIDDIVLR